MIEDKDFLVRLTIHLTTTVSFSPTERNTHITHMDAIDNAIGMLPENIFTGFDGEFEIALPIDGEVLEERDWIN